jgi:hypothetical protein
MPNTSVVDGRREIIHVVSSGESLSLIAANYRKGGWPVKGWQPIYRLTRRRTGLWATKGTQKQTDNPELLQVGDVLVLPRSAAGYDAVIKKTQQLGEELFLSGETEAQRIKREADKFGDQIDLISDILQLAVGAGFKANKIGKAIAEVSSKKLTGLSAKLKLLEASADALEWAAKLKMLLKKKDEAYLKKAKPAYSGGKTALHIADFLQDEAVKQMSRAGKGLRAFYQFVDVVLDYVDPSKLAMTWIWVTTLEHPNNTMKDAVQKALESRETTLKFLGDKIAALKAEKEYVHGK